MFRAIARDAGTIRVMTADVTAHSGRCDGSAAAAGISYNRRLSRLRSSA
jgi:hypothetical protein